MGSCNFEKLNRSSPTKHNIEFIPVKEDYFQLTFHLKIWPYDSGINLAETNTCIQDRIQPVFDNTQKLEIMIKNSRRIREESSIDLTKLNTMLKCLIQKKDKSFSIALSSVKQNQTIWRCINDWTQFQEHEIIKIGKTKYRLCKLQHESSLIEIERPISNINLSYSSCQEIMCRICRLTCQNEENPLISPCKCNGAIKYMHMKCLIKWLFGSTLSENVKIQTNKYNCEFCQTDIRETKQYHQMINYLLSHPQDIPAPYAIFEHIYGKDQQSLKNYFILSFKNKLKYSIGRSRNSDICDASDKFMSKAHCQIKYADEKLMVRDCSSLHGTMVKLAGSLTLTAQHPSESVTYKNMLVNIIYTPFRGHLA